MTHEPTSQQPRTLQRARTGRRRVVPAACASFLVVGMAAATVQGPGKQDGQSVETTTTPDPRKERAADDANAQRRAQRQDKAVPTPSPTSGLDELPDGRLFFEGYYRQYLIKDLKGAAEAYELLTAREHRTKYHLQAFTELIEIYRDQLLVGDVIRVLQRLEAYQPEGKRNETAAAIEAIERVRAEYEKKFEQAREAYKLDRDKLGRGRPRQGPGRPQRMRLLEEVRSKLLQAMRELSNSETSGYLVPGDITDLLQTRRVRGQQLRERLAQQKETLRILRGEGKGEGSPDVIAQRNKISDTLAELQVLSAGRVSVPATITQIQNLRQQQREANQDKRTAMARHYAQRIRRLANLLPEGTWIPPAREADVKRYSVLLQRVITKLENQGDERVEYAKQVRRQLLRWIDSDQWRLAAKYWNRRRPKSADVWLRKMVTDEVFEDLGRRPRAKPGPRRRNASGDGNGRK